MLDYKFLFGLRLYIIIIHYSIFVGYVYGNYKNYNVTDSVIISTTVGVLTPFFIPIHYIFDLIYKEKILYDYENIEENIAPLITFKYLCSKYEKIKPIKNRV